MAFSFNHQGQMIMRQLLKFSETDQQNPLVHFLRFTVVPYQNSRSLLKQESNFHSKQKGSFQASLLLSFRKSLETALSNAPSTFSKSILFLFGNSTRCLSN